MATKAASSKAALPTNDAAFKAMDTRLGQEMGRCARDYDEARTHLKSHAQAMTKQEAGLMTQIAALKPQVDALLDGKIGLTKPVAKACLEYMALLAKLQTTRQGKRLAYGATVPAGEQPLGQAIGTPNIPDKEGGTPGKEISKGMTLAFVLEKSAGGKWKPEVMPPPPGVKPLALPKLPAFKMPKIAFKFKTAARAATGARPLSAPKMPKAPAPPAAPTFNAATAASHIGATVHETHERTTKPLWGKPETQQAHLMSHATPQKAIKHMRASIIAGGGTVSGISDMRVPHADGTTAHKYSFEHTDAGGVKHIVHMMRKA